MRRARCRMSTDLFDGLSYEELMAELGWRMSRISKVATCDSWHYTVDEEMPRVCYEIALSGSQGHFDTEPISVVTARLLVALADRLGQWVVPDNGLGWKPYVAEAMKVQSSCTSHGGQGADNGMTAVDAES